MEPLQLIVRAAFAFIFLLVLVRVSGKRTVAQANVADFVLALIFGDMVDDLIWGEIPGAEFAVALGTLFIVRVAFGLLVHVQRSRTV